jgi:hypothetical protein
MQRIMKAPFLTILFFSLSAVTLKLSAQPKITDTAHSTAARHLYIDVHQLEPGKITNKAVAEAHAKDLAVEGKYNVDILKYWVDLDKARVFCLASAPDTAALLHTHEEAHGLLPSHIYPVSEGMAAALKGKDNLYLDIHYLGAGNVTAEAVAAAHQKDLAVQGKYGVNLLDYWVNERDGVVMCLAQAKDSTDLIKTHKEAHGLIPAEVYEVKQGNK